MQTNEKRRFQIDPNNKPLHRPGVYLIRNLSNGKQYVGLSKDVANRLKDHACGHGCSPVLAKAIRKYGADSFSAAPVFYSLKGTDCLLDVETALIAEHNCIEHGYNVQAASQSYGPYGPHHAESVRAAHKRPEVKAKLLAGVKRKESDPDFIARRLEYLKVTNGDPVIAAKRLENLRAAAKLPSRSQSTSAANKRRMSAPGSTDMQKMQQGWKNFVSQPGYQEWAAEQGRIRMSNPDIRERVITKMRGTMATEEFKEKRSAASKAMHTSEVRAKKSEIMSAAWRVPGFKEAFSEARRGFRWITNGSENKHYRGEAEPPEGWWFGKSAKT